jgi:ribokinase
MTRVVVIGNATVDVIQRVERFPLPGETLLCGAMVVCAGGKGLNQAIASARTGAPTRLCAPVAADTNGDLLVHAVAAETGLDADWLSAPLPTDMSTIWIDAQGENMIVSAAAAAGAMGPADVTAACAALSASDVLLVQGNLSQSTTAVAIAQARAKGARIVLNTAPIQPWMAALLDGIDVVVANALEVAQLAGGQDEPEAALLRAGARAVVVSRGRAGAVLATDRSRSLVAAPAVVAVDTAGAGDVLTGTLAGLLAQGVEIAAALDVAVAAASLSVTRSGTTPSFPSCAEIAALRVAPVAGAPEHCRA